MHDLVAPSSPEQEEAGLAANEGLLPVNMKYLFGTLNYTNLGTKVQLSTGFWCFFCAALFLDTNKPSRAQR